ncbi:fatty acyl-AMP ligase [Crossiella cryophila]|uniref:Fatty-acyl-CoA synthase n=1 Tax=Crossiella cryophila TaxID=43355 RepID=A0A7W7FRB9_9PSEU|nr:fatty acyl-AMP ligase [Crossiella cryophila]MBB4674183.1 fatty-acyl-CoA synthase [Crossiella cryophila]
MSRFVETMVATAGNPVRRGITTGAPQEPIRRTWSEVHLQARRIAGALLAAGVSPRDSVGVLAADPGLIAPAVQGIWLAGASVTMLHQPTPRTDLVAWAGDTVRTLRMISSVTVVLDETFAALAEPLRDKGIRVLPVLELTGGAPAEPVHSDEDDPALLQLTSGSTAEPKAVVISHGNLIANIEAMTIAAELAPETDVMVSWLPLFHDMGMVGFLTVPMTVGMELVKITPVEFLRSPLSWPELITTYRGTITAAPNFGYAVFARQLSKVDDESRFDLSRLRIALSGAEPIDPAVTRGFTEQGARFGMPAECVLCAYGMAEATLAVSFAPLRTGLVLDEVRGFPLLGPPLPGLEVRAIGAAGEVLPEHEIGELQVRGAAVTAGYLTVDGPLATQDEQGWLSTGDEGYLAGGQVVVCGRRKDVIILGGRNIYPTDVERAACAAPDVRPGNAVAVRWDGNGRERLAVVVESRRAGEAEAVRLIRKNVAAEVVHALGVRPNAVVVLPPGELPKTPSGKLRRTEVRERLGEWL